MTPEASRIRYLMLTAAIKVLQREQTAIKAAFQAADDVCTSETEGDFELQYELSVYLKDHLLDHAESYLTGNFSKKDANIIHGFLLNQPEERRTASYSAEQLDHGLNRIRTAAEQVFNEKDTSGGARNLAIKAANGAIESYVSYAGNNSDLHAALLEQLQPVVNRIRNLYKESQQH